ncbi:hypothetical protein BU23DRAFT_363354, partial [Bimuria novae-zelandiae CBS 107.79]
PDFARRQFVQAHTNKWTGKDSLEDGVVDESAKPGEIPKYALRRARKVRDRAKTGVNDLLRR